MNPFLPALAASLITAVPAAAASLRSAATLTAPVVRLSDLFDDAGARADRVLGPGPAPGGRIVVEAAQLAAIARQFGVDWRPASPADRSVLDRPGRLLAREDIFAALRAALAAVGAPADGDLDLPGYTAPMVPLESHTEVAIEQLDYEGASGRFAATLVVTGTDMPTERMRLSGRVQEMVELPVLARRLPAGSVLRPGVLLPARVRASGVRGETVRNAADAVGQALKHLAVAGQPLSTTDLMRPVVVQKGARVMMQLFTPGLALTGQGVALDAGGMGERIRVLNPSSRAVLEVEVIGPERVRVSPGSMPLETAAPGSVALAQVAVR
jgi:flagella basal body P-ring formation protein FlgA